MIVTILTAIGVYQVAAWTLQALRHGQDGYPILTETVVLCALVGWLGIVAREIFG